MTTMPSGKKTYSEWDINMSVILHAGFGQLGIFASQHLDKCMSLILVDNACLYGTVAAKDGA